MPEDPNLRTTPVRTSASASPTQRCRSHPSHFPLRGQAPPTPPLRGQAPPTSHSEGRPPPTSLWLSLPSWLVSAVSPLHAPLSWPWPCPLFSSSLVPPPQHPLGTLTSAVITFPDSEPVPGCAAQWLKGDMRWLTALDCFPTGPSPDSPGEALAPPVSASTMAPPDTAARGNPCPSASHSR